MSLEFRAGGTVRVEDAPRDEAVCRALERLAAAPVDFFAAAAVERFVDPAARCVPVRCVDAPLARFALRRPGRARGRLPRTLPSSGVC